MKTASVGISKGSASRKCSKSLHFDFGSLRRDYYTHWIRVLFLGYFKIGLHSIEIFQTRISFPRFPAFLLNFSKNAGYDSLFSKYLMLLYLCCPQPFNLAYINKIGGSSFPRRWIQHFWEDGWDAEFVMSMRFSFVAITRPLRYVKHRTNSRRATGNLLVYLAKTEKN